MDAKIAETGHVERTVKTSHGAIRLVDTGGTGFPLLLLHGSGSSRAVFARQVRSPLNRAARIIAIDLPGHGDSEDARDPQKTYTVTGLADCVEEVLRDLRIPRVAVVGWSLGGHVGIELLSRRRQIAGLIVTGAPPVAPGLLGMLRGFHPSFDILLASKDVFSERDAKRFETLCFGDSADPAFRQAILRTDGRVRAVFSRSLMRGDGADQLATVLNADVPVGFVNGMDDPFVRLGYVAALRLRRPFDGGAHAIEGVGHASFWEQPIIFNAIVEKFLYAVAANEQTSLRTLPALYAV